MSRVELPDGAWAELHSPKKVSERKRRTFINSMADFQKALGLMPQRDDGNPDQRLYGSAEQELLDNAMDRLIVCLVDAWSFEQPVSVDALEDFPVDVHDTLLKACTALQGELLPDFGVSPDPKAATAASTTLPTG